MKRSSFAVIALSALALIFFSVGCSKEEGSEGPATATSPPKSAASAGAGAPAESTGLITPSRDTPLPDVAEGAGTIKGVLKSPYARVAEGVVFIESVESKLGPPSKNPVMDQKNKIFIPHLLPIMAGSTVDFPNTDDVRHSVYARPGSAAKFNLGQYAAGVIKHIKIDELGVTHLACNIHKEMSAYVISLQNPYFAMTDRKGNFELHDVPAGRRRLTLFHEKLESKTIEVLVEADKETHAEFTGLKRRR